ncbi:MAG: relaxase MobL [Thermaerobacter sp.]|nr:relaxase MobL [Thermaerobacter sp.]
MRPFVLKAHFYLPASQGGHGKTSMKAAVGHLHYMIDPERHQSAAEELLMPDHMSAAIHAKYMIERPGSLGGFGPNASNPPDPREVAKLFETHEGPIWRAFISVKEEDARQMGGGLFTRKTWEDAARKQLPHMAAALGIKPDNIDWVAAVHRKEGHPHMHLLAWEKVPTRERGKWSPEELREIKKGWVRELYAPAREQANAEKNTARQGVVNATKHLMDTPMVFLPKVDREAFRQHLQAVRDQLPDRGSLRYAYLPADAKEAVDGAADWLMAHVDPIRESAEKYVSTAKELGQIYRDAAVGEAAENARQELRERMARTIIDSARRLDRPLDHPMARVATTSVLWQTWKNSADSPIDRDQLLDVVDAVRLGRLTSAQAVQMLVSDPMSKKAQSRAEAAIEKMSDMRQKQIDHAELQNSRRTAQSVSASLSRMARQAGRGAVRQQWEIEQAQLERERQTGHAL